MANWITRLLGNRRGGGVVDLIGALAVVSIGLGVISMVTAGFYNNIDRSQFTVDENNQSIGNATLSKVVTSTWGGIAMATVIPYVLVGVGVIGLVIRGFGGSGG